ncbi:hypothetical protein COBT_001006 [Conglomerata obtusa]
MTIILSVLAIFSYFLSFKLIHLFAVKTPLKGKDFHKNDNILLPEAIGIASGLSFITTLFILLIFEEKTTYFYNVLAISASCLFTILLGFIDDVLDLEWRYKLIFPAVSIIPTILLYSEGTKVILPIIGLTNIHIFYYLYMIACTTFTTNAINIFSGINGLEVLQILIISLFLFLDSLIKMNTLGITVTLFLFFSSLPLYYYNKYPASVFVGDTYCYFGGMALGSVSILCHTTRTLFLLMMPQIINFIISLPQLLKLVYCPRHRMPDFDGCYLRPSTFIYNEKKINNFTLLNLILHFAGPLTEKNLCVFVGYGTIIWCGCVIFLKHTLYAYYLSF